MRIAPKKENQIDIHKLGILFHRKYTKKRMRLKGSSLRLSHLYASFDFLSTLSQLSISGYLAFHSFYDTADPTEPVHVERSANLLQIISPKGKIILSVSENRFPRPPPVHYMIPCIRMFYSQWSGHNLFYITQKHEANADPFTFIDFWQPVVQKGIDERSRRRPPQRILGADPSEKIRVASCCCWPVRLR